MAEPLSEAFQAHRPHLLRVAYGTLGSLDDAEDVVQEAYLRLRRVEDPGAIEDLRAWLTVTTGRLALDALRRAHRAREIYPGQWLPEPVVENPDAHPADPADRLTLDETITVALLAVLERLTPAERAAWVLHDLFAVSFEEVGEIVGRTPAAVRQLAARARRHLAAEAPRVAVGRGEHERVVGAFMRACTEGDLPALLATLDERVVWRSDGGGLVNAMRRPLNGRERVAKALLGFARRPPRAARTALVNGRLGIVLRDADDVLNVIALEVAGGRIRAIDSIRNPEKLRRVELS